MGVSTLFVIDFVPSGILPLKSFSPYITFITRMRVRQEKDEGLVRWRRKWKWRARTRGRRDRRGGGGGGGSQEGDGVGRGRRERQRWRWRGEEPCGDVRRIALAHPLLGF